MKEAIEILILILAANGSPVFISYLFSHKASFPLDFRLKLKDQQPLFGPTKTWRGVLASLTLTTLIAYALDYTISSGLLISSLAMSGDLLSSFIKRRLKITPGSRFILLDQIPESLMPALGYSYFIGHSFELIHMIVIVICFTIIDMTLSKILYKIGIRKNPH